MKVTVSVSGRFHAFDMAGQLHRHHDLDRLITSYPTFETPQYGVPAERVTSLLRYELINRGWHRYLERRLSRHVDFNSWYCDAFDRAAARHIPQTSDVFIGWASKSELGLQLARDMGALAVLDRGSSHALYNRRILREEYETFGVGKALVPEGIIQKELREYELADYILIPSEFVKRTFLEQGIPESKLITIPYGVDLRSFQPGVKRDSRFRVLYVGGMKLNKGVHYLLEAFDKLNLPGAELWLVGSKCEEIDRFFTMYSRNVTYFGHVPQSQLSDIYCQCSVFAICSNDDGFGMVVPQAMACGLPVICTANVGGADLITEGEQGFTVPIRSVDSIAEKLLWCYRNQEKCREMGASARQKVGSGFSWDAYGDNLVAELHARQQQS